MKPIYGAGIAILAIVAFCGGSSAATDKQCLKYASDAIMQYKMMISYPGCKLKANNRWHASFRRHYDWCRTADLQAVDAETLKRENHLIECGVVDDGMNPVEN